jgi:GntR family transcriptional regulator
VDVARIRVDTGSETPMYVQIMAQLRALVRDGELGPGTLLPSVRQLASDLEVNPNTVAKAYMLLEAEDVVRTTRRRGTYVAEYGAREAAQGSRARLIEAIDRMLDEAKHLRLDREALLEELERRVEAWARRER